MAKNESRRLKPTVLETDKASFAALQAINGYAPANSAYSMTTITAAQNVLNAAQQAEAQAQAAAATARDEATAREWEFHNLMLGAKDQVMAQFGRDSNEVQAIGLKKASEYKPRPRKPKSPTA